MNTGAPWPEPESAWWRVLEIQTKLHQWATDAPDRRFDDLYNLVCDPAVLVDGVGTGPEQRGARSAGVDGQPPSTSPARRRGVPRRSAGRLEGP